MAEFAIDDGYSEPWLRAHEALLKLAEQRAELDLDEGKWLLLAFRTGAHARLGYGSFVEYAERLFGYTPRLTKEKLRVAEALEGLPAMTQELAQGSINFSAARELTRVATRFTESEWLAAARGKTAREIEQLVSGHRPGARPTDNPDSGARRHVIRLEVSGDTLATFRDAMAEIRRRAGEPLDDDAATLLMARAILEGPKDEGRASYQVAVTVCADCARMRQHGGGSEVEVSAQVADIVACDAQHVGETADTHVGVELKPAKRATQEVPPATRRAVLRRDGHHCQVPGCTHATFVDVHHIETRAEGGGHDPDNLITLCSAHHRAIHEGRLLLVRDADGRPRFRHADGTTYGAGPSAKHCDIGAKAFQALRGLGFREGEIKRVLAETHVGPDADLTQLVRTTIHALTAS